MAKTLTLPFLLVSIILVMRFASASLIPDINVASNSSIKLDQPPLFTFNHDNEPTELISLLFNRAGAPWLTQKWVRESMKVYLTGPEGMAGDDDCGQMSAWYVLAAFGLQQICSGDPRFEIDTPLFDKETLKLDPKYTKGGTFTITTKNQSPDNIYIQSATFNGKPFNRCWLSYSEISAGGTLDLVLGPKPNKNWGVQ